MKESLGWHSIHKRIAIIMAFIMVFTMLPMNALQAYAESKDSKILIWSTYILQTEVKKLYAPDLKEFISKKEVAGYAGVDSISVDLKEGAQDNPLHFTGTEDLSEYDLIIVLMPYEALTDTDVSVLKNYLNAGGRIVLQGERDGFAKYENKVLSDFAGKLGVTFQITINDDDQDNAIINKDSDIMGGQDLVGNELEYRAIGELTYSGDAQVIATSVDKKYPFIVDFPVQKGRITVMSDVNWWHRRSNMLHTPAQLQSAQELWGRFLSNSIKNMEAVKNGMNPNEKYGHHFNYISQGNQILAYCDKTHGASECEYYGISNAVAVTLSADDAFYSGEAYSGVTLEGTDTYNAVTESNLDKSQVSFYQVETKGTTSGGIKLESAPKEKGHYYAAITSNGAQAVAAFSIVGLAHSITIKNGTTEIADSKATEGTIVTIKADPAPTGKEFDKWVVESGSITLADAKSATTTFIMPDSEVTVTATFVPATYTVNLNTNGGTINSGDVTGYTYGQGATLPTDVTKAGYIFKGWYGNETFTGDPVTEISTTDTGVKKYWAKWIGNGLYPISQIPTIESGEGVKVTLSTDGTVATITVEAGYDLADVVLNGVSQGKTTEVKGLKTGDKLVVTAEKKAEEPKKEEIHAALADQQLTARSKLVTMKNGKKAVKITWYNENGEMMDFDGVEIYRSTKRYSGYGKTPFFNTEKDVYYNTAIKAGNMYYYKVRGYIELNGEKIYTDWSMKAIRTVK